MPPKSGAKDLNALYGDLNPEDRAEHATKLKLAFEALRSEFATSNKRTLPKNVFMDISNSYLSLYDKSTDWCSSDASKQSPYRPSSPVARKPKRKAKESKNTRHKRVKLFSNLNESLKWQRQYYQGKKITDLSSGLGCGWHLLGSPMVPFQSPLDGEMSFEISSGTGETGSGSIRLCGKDDDGEDEMPPTCLVPFVHIEQVIVLHTPFKSVPKSRAYQVIIVPTAATGSSPILRQSPDIISFNWPDKKADENLKGTIGEAANKSKDTYLSVLKQVLDEQLAATEKAVIVLDKGKEDQVFSCSTTLCYRRNLQSGKKEINGEIHFLGTGLLFLSQDRRLHLPFRSLESADVLMAKERVKGKDRPVSLEFHSHVSEPYYESKNSKEAKSRKCIEKYLRLSFKDMPISLLDKLKDFLANHNIEITEYEQIWDEFGKGLPRSGWNPVTESNIFD